MADDRVLERAVTQIRELERMIGPPGPPGTGGVAGDITIADVDGLQAELDALDTADTSEATTRAAGDATNSAALVTEAANRASGDASLASDLDDESDARIAGDATNAAAVTTEATARAAADTTLQTNLDGKQPLHANLTALAGLVGASDRLAYFTAVGTLALTTLSAFARTLLDDADAEAARTTLGAASEAALNTVESDSIAADGLLDGRLDVFEENANLSALMALVGASDRLAYFTAVGTLSLATFTAAGRALVDDADATAQRATLGLVIGTNVQAYSSILAALVAFTGIADGQYVKRSGAGYVGDTPAGGGTSYTVRSKTAAYTAVAGDVILCDVSAGTFTITLPAAASNTNAIIVVKKTDAGPDIVTVDGNASETIDGDLTYLLWEQHESVTLISDGTNWRVI